VLGSFIVAAEIQLR